jgi:hypothetical protein
VFVVMVIYMKKNENISITKITYLIRPLIKYAPTILFKTMTLII